MTDRVMVLRDGRHVQTARIGDVSQDQLIEMMAGRPVEAEFPQRTAAPGHERLRVENLAREPAVRGPHRSSYR